MNATAKRALLLAARNSLIAFVAIAGFLAALLSVAHANLAPAPKVGAATFGAAARSRPC